MFGPGIFQWKTWTYEGGLFEGGLGPSESIVDIVDFADIVHIVDIVNIVDIVDVVVLRI